MYAHLLEYYKKAVGNSYVYAVNYKISHRNVKESKKIAASAKRVVTNWSASQTIGGENCDAKLLSGNSKWLFRAHKSRI